MKYLYSIIIFCGVFLILGASLINAEADNRQNTPEKTVFASFNLMQSMPEVPLEMPIYKTITPKFSEEYIEKLMHLFELEGKIVDHRRQYLIRNQERVLEIFKEPGTGFIRYCDDAKLLAESEAKNLPSEVEAKKRAEEFLKSNGLLPENTFFAGIGYSGFKEHNSEGEEVRKGKTSIAVGFGFKIGEMKVIGPGAKASVVFGENGEIIKASKIWREIKLDKKMKIITPEEAFELFKKRWPREGDPGQLEDASIKTEVNINEIYFTYYTKPGSIPQDYIEPAYLFTGDYTITEKKEEEIRDRDEFSIMIPAIPKD